jgi:hypothetical protein
MESSSQAVATVRSDRVKLTDTERATIDALNAVSFAVPAAPEGVEVLAEARKALARDTLEALRSAIPDLEERTRAQAERWKPDFDKLKGTDWPVYAFSPDLLGPDPEVHRGHVGPPATWRFDHLADRDEVRLPTARRERHLVPASSRFCSRICASVR